MPVRPVPFTFRGILYTCAHRNTRWISLTWSQTCSMGVRMSLPYCTRACVQPYPVGCTVPRRSGTKPEPGSPNKSGYSEGVLTVDHTTPYRRDEQVFACSSRCFQRCAKHHFPFEKWSKAPTKRKKILKGLRPSGSDLGPISGRTPPSVQTPRRRPEGLCSLTRGAAVCAGLGAIVPPRACSAPPRSRLWICTACPG